MPRSNSSEVDRLIYRLGKKALANLVLSAGGLKKQVRRKKKAKATTKETK